MIRFGLLQYMYGVIHNVILVAAQTDTLPALIVCVLVWAYGEHHSGIRNKKGFQSRSMWSKNVGLKGRGWGQNADRR